VVSEIDGMMRSAPIEADANRYPTAKTRVFVDFLAERFGDEPVWDGVSRKTWGPASGQSRRFRYVCGMSG
jgi:hypothetical protein